MKTGKVLKSAEVSVEDLEKIHRYTRREFSPEEIYSFSVVLCDNDVDRDYERFTVEALFELEKLFVGKTGVFDHAPKAENQTARIFDCRVEAVQGRKTKTGDDYFRLVAKAYLPKCAKTEDMILAIDSGILKEVSVGCAVAKKRCSICMEKAGTCSHTKGEVYGGALCCVQLEQPIDAYEWSFVAVPAQREAGILKRFVKGGETQVNNAEACVTMKEFIMQNAEALEKCRESGQAVFSYEELKELSAYVKNLERDALDGKAYRQELKKDFLRLSAIVQPEIAKATAEAIAGKLTVYEMKECIGAYEKKVCEKLPVLPQTYRGETSESKQEKNKEFEI